jgi:uncharacterized protein YndB with AHSA1/START domain
VSLQKDGSGRRWIQVEVEVPGTPEEVWEAIATGPGVSSWFVPTEIDAENGVTTSHFGPGMDSAAQVTEWDPPHRFAATSADMGPTAPPVATEWIVEARDGGTCVVRVIHSLFASTDDWDDQLSSFESGWPAFFRILRLYLRYFRGERCSAFRSMGAAPAPAAAAWTALTAPLGLAGAVVGEQWNAGYDAPPFGGIVEGVGDSQRAHQVLLRLDEPAPGIAFLFAHEMGGQVMVIVSLYLYGDGAAAAAERDQPLWETWMKERFAPLGEMACG